MNKAKIIYLSDKYWWKYILFCPKKNLFFVLEKNKSTGINRAYQYKKHLINDRGLKTILDKEKETCKIGFILRARLTDKKIKYLIDDGFFSVYMSASWGLMYSTINRLH